MNQEHDDDEEVHAIVIHENELTQEDLDQEDGAVIEYAEAASDTEEIEGEENEMSYELQVPFEKVIFIYIYFDDFISISV